MSNFVVQLHTAQFPVQPHHGLYKRIIIRCCDIKKKVLLHTPHKHDIFDNSEVTRLSNTAYKYSHSIANLFRKLLIMTKESSTMRTLMNDFIAARRCLMIWLLFLAGPFLRSSRFLRCPLNLVKLPTQFRGQRSHFVSRPAGLSLSITTSPRDPSSAVGAGQGELIQSSCLYK